MNKAEEFRQIRLKLELSQGQLARYLKCCYTLISKYENGARNVTEEMFNKLKELEEREDLLNEIRQSKNTGKYERKTLWC